MVDLKIEIGDFVSDDLNKRKGRVRSISPSGVLVYWTNGAETHTEAQLLRVLRKRGRVVIPRVWYRTGTGGGCTAERCDLPDGRYALLTDYDEDATAPSARTTHYLIGLYSADDDQIGDCHDGTLESCDAWLESELAK